MHKQHVDKLPIVLGLASAVCPICIEDSSHMCIFLTVTRIYRVNNTQNTITQYSGVLNSLTVYILVALGEFLKRYNGF